MPTPSDAITKSTQCVFDVHWRDSTVVISCAGELDMNTAPELGTRIKLLLKDGPSSMIVDLTPLTFLASHGLSVLLEADELCSPAIRFAVVATGRATYRPMQLTGITDVVSVRETLDRAIEAVAT